MRKITAIMIVLFAVTSIAQIAAVTPAPAAAAPVSLAAVLAAVFAALLAISEALSYIPSVKANGIFQLIQNLLKSAVSKDTTPST